MNQDVESLPAVRERSEVEQRLTRLSRIADLMDDQFELPLIKYRIGLDPIIGLFAGAGDWVTWIVSVYVFWQALKLGVPVSTLFKMAWNITIDLVVGYVPGLGDAFDFLFKANRRNVDLVFEHFGATSRRSTPGRVEIPDAAPVAEKRSTFQRYLIGFGLLLVLLVLAVAPIVLLWWLLSS